MKTPLLLTGVAATLLALAGQSQAQSANFNTWTAAGDVLVGSATAARLSTANLDLDETRLSGSSALQFDALELALGLAAGTLAADTFEGSGLALNFSVAAASTLSFNWTLASSDTFDAGFADRSFMVVDGSQILPLGTLAAGPVGGSVNITFSTLGSHALAFVVMDVNDATGVSTLSLSDLSVSAVPEPASWALLLSGAAGVAGVARIRLLAQRRRQA